MDHFMFTRRSFLKGCGGAALASCAGVTLLYSEDALAANTYDTVVHLFLRGGWDGLNFVMPTTGASRIHYEQARPQLAIAASGAYGALPLTLADGSSTGFGMHPSATGLHDLWNDKYLAIVHSCGLATVVTRSHFDAQLYLDLGTPGSRVSSTGWLSRAWNFHPGKVGTGAVVPVLGVANTQPASLMGSTAALTMGSPSDFQLNAGAWQWQMARSGSPTGLRGVNETLSDLWAGTSTLESAGQRANGSLNTIATQAFGALPSDWPNNGFSQQLWTIAQSIRLNLGLRYATLDLGGWDTHEGQGSAGAGYHYYQNKIAELSSGLHAFFNALQASGHMSRTTVIVQSEFGRRVRENANAGTDHGYGNPMLVLGGTVNGRRFYGKWLGLKPEVLSPYYGDVPVTTDYRRVLSEVLIRRMKNPKLGSVFPGYSGYSPLGVMKGTDMTPEYAAYATASSLACLSTSV